MRVWREWMRFLSTIAQVAMLVLFFVSAVNHWDLHDELLFGVMSILLAVDEIRPRLHR